jgi:uncharacterized pyridoxal phosphate-containing UPF0001 family protein
MNQEIVKALQDKELSQIIVWAEDEIRARAEKRKQDTIAKIKELAGSVGVSVSFIGKRGRPSRKVEFGVAKTKKA